LICRNCDNGQLTTDDTCTPRHDLLGKSRPGQVCVRYKCGQTMVDGLLSMVS
jgi:hypothetical protein